MNLLILSALALYAVDPYADAPHLPDALPADARETDVLETFAAQGEIESASWLVRSDAAVGRLDCRLGPLKGPDGAEIPAAALDLKVVKVWFQPDGFWTTSWAGNIRKPVAIPALLLHDDALVRVDWEKKVNFLRIDYADGPVWCRMSGPDLTDPLNHSVHPIRDAKAYVPCALEAGRLKQFWLTVKTPADAKPGAYAGEVTLVADGGERRALKLRHVVHPFALPRARTHYDSSRPYVCTAWGAVTVRDYFGQCHDLAHAERKSLAAYRALAEHNLCDADGPGAVAAESPDDLGYRTLYVMRQAGLPLESFRSGPTESGGDASYVPRMTSLYARYASPGCRAHYVGIDEASPDACRAQYGVWSAVQAAGGFVESAMADAGVCGWALDRCHTPALVSHSHARAWHRLGAQVTTYASPFAGPECPSIWRRTKGLRFYYCDFDGVTEYCLYYHARNRWNEFIPSPDGYRSFGLVYPAYEELIGTVAFEALREGMDDVRYLSLLKLRAEAALRSADPQTVLLGKRHLAWMDSRDPERVGPLDAFRLELARRICELVAVVGPEPAPPALRPMPPPGPTSLDRLAADESVPADERAAKCEAGGRHELAIPLYARVRGDSGRTAVDRLKAFRREVPLRLGRLDRAGALAAADALLADGEIPPEDRAALELERMEIALTQVKFRERFASAQIADAERTLERLKRRGVESARRFSLTWKLAKIVLDSDDPSAALKYDESYCAENGFAGGQCGRLLYCRAEACRRIGGMEREAYRALKRAADLGGADLGGETRNLGGEVGVLAERFGEYETAQKYYFRSMSAWPPGNDVWYPRWRAAFRRVTGKLSKATEVSSALKAEDDIIPLDEE